MDEDVINSTTNEYDEVKADLVQDDIIGIRRHQLESEMEDSYLQYSMSVIVSRALPDVRDGLKPVHRRILYAMDVNNWKFSGKTIKSARITGEVMGKYHPHGNAAIYDAMARMTQPFSLRYPLIVGQGNFGSMDGDPPAAERYTEAKLNRYAEMLLEDLDKETVSFRDNYDGSYQEPEVLPAKLPNLIINGQMGIAVGMATNIPPHNLSEVCEAIIYMIDNPEYSVEDITSIVKGPDFPTGGIIYGSKSIASALTTGKGGVICRGVAEIVETKTGRSQIIISEIPYGVNKSTLVEKIAELYKDKKISIADLKDSSARGEVKIVIDLKKDSYPKKVLNQLYKLTSLQTTFHYNTLALVDGIQPRILGIKDVLVEYLKHRQVVVRKRTEFELSKAKARAHILEGLTIALDHIDEIISTIRSSDSSDDAKSKLIAKFKLSELQAQAILNMQLRSLAGLERKKIEDELQELLTLIKKLEAILSSEQEILKIIKEEVQELKDKYGDERRTKIVTQELGSFRDEDLIPNEEAAIIITSQDYIKRALLSDYRKQNRGGKGKRGISTKESDFIKQLVVAGTHDQLLFFTNKGRVLQTKAYEVPQVGPNAKGTSVANLLNLQPEERITTVLNTAKDISDKKNLFMATNKGVVKKTALTAYENIRSNGIISINLDKGDELGWVSLTSGSDEIILSTSNGQALRFKESDVRVMGRTARGVRGMRLRPGDEIVGMDIVEPDSTFVVISENGYGKKTNVEQFTTHARGGVGIKTAIVNTKTGKIVSVKAVSSSSDPKELMVISTSGQVIRLGLKDVPKLGRTTQGVRVMRLSDEDKVAGFELVDESIDQEEVEDNSSE
jgi:DNA gyrase subunit A